ncbi:MAG: DUF2285 domain-containing protein [Sphingomonadaceae bacterium]|nr:DUF2285 domain-containing protein [Sphingomonadaceae bacterium]
MSADPMAQTRLEAALLFATLQASKPASKLCPRFAPSRYQRTRLSQMLAIADARASGASARDIASGLIFRNAISLDGRNWANSSEQRQTRRMLAETAAMIDGGFWRFPCFV